ncbi:MAG: tRNA (N6-threonylcarbamoyladenosine(37)-N6)-methyltransferase TrmO [Candidatus Alcyoniella australis]|nr:tRNA (N6-threonylcarbamoyladenosine(37)-N6)-methyltransferase TrmO [Candidatus Alcyoniella australis]
MKSIEFKPIGIIRSPFKVQAGTPIKPRMGGATRGEVQLDPAYVAGLADLDGFEHIWLIYLCHDAGPCSLSVKPYLDDQAHGLFATRAPSRPNPIGISSVRLCAVRGNVLEVEGLDVLDQTPLLDIKPYVPGFDSIPQSRSGWIEGRTQRDTLADDRFKKGSGGHL